MAITTTHSPLMNVRVSSCSKERRQAAAAAARERLAADKSRLEVGNEGEEDKDDEKLNDEEQDEHKAERMGVKQALRGDSIQHPVAPSHGVCEEGSAEDSSPDAADAPNVTDAPTAMDAAEGTQPRLSRAQRVAHLERELPLLLHSRCATFKVLQYSRCCYIQGVAHLE